MILLLEEAKERLQFLTNDCKNTVLRDEYYYFMDILNGCIHQYYELASEEDNVNEYISENQKLEAENEALKAELEQQKLYAELGKMVYDDDYFAIGDFNNVEEIRNIYNQIKEREQNENNA
jgi:regulator of replication initiation timing